MIPRLFQLLLALLVIASPAIGVLSVELDEQVEQEEKAEKHEKRKDTTPAPRIERPARIDHPQITHQLVAPVVSLRDTSSTHTVSPRQLTERRQN